MIHEDFTFLEGAGTTEAPFLISNLSELEDFRDTVNSGVSTVGLYFKQNNDITLAFSDLVANDTYTSFTTSTGAGWVPIGTASHPFKGTFDGAKVDNLCINATSSFCGFFGVCEDANIKNLEIGNGYVLTTSNETGTGGCVGKAANTFLEFCKNRANIQAATSRVGGIVGYAFSDWNKLFKFADCENFGTLRTTAEGIGGIVGRLDSHPGNHVFQRNINRGDIFSASSAGGVIGWCEMYANVTFSSCANFGDITSAGHKVGGLIGFVTEAPDIYDLKLKFFCNKGKIIGSVSVGGIVGQFNSKVQLYQSYNIGPVIATGTGVGGILGVCDGGGSAVYACYNIGSVEGSAGVGGIQGQNTKKSSSEYATLQNCYNTGKVTAATTGGRLLGGPRIAHANSANNYVLSSAKLGASTPLIVASETSKSFFDFLNMPTTADLNSSEVYFQKDTSFINDGFPILAEENDFLYPPFEEVNKNVGSVAFSFFLKILKDAFAQDRSRITTLEGKVTALEGA